MLTTTERLSLTMIVIIQAVACRSTQTQLADDRIGPRGPYTIEEQYVEGHEIISNTLKVAEWYTGRKYILNSFSIDLSDATMHYKNFVFAYHTGRVKGLLYYEGSEPKNESNSDFEIAYIDVEKKVVSSSNLNAIKPADCFQKALAVLQRFEDPRAAEIAADISRLKVNPEVGLYSSVNTPNHLSGSFTSREYLRNVPTFSEIFDALPTSQLFTAKIPGATYPHYELEISRGERTTRYFEKSVTLTLRKKIAMIPYETSVITFLEQRDIPPFNGRYVTIHQGQIKSNELGVSLYTLSPTNSDERMKYLSIALGMLDTAGVDKTHKLRQFVDAHSQNAQAVLYETTVEKLAASAIDQLVIDKEKSAASEEDKTKTTEAVSEADTGPRDGEQSSDENRSSGSAERGAVRGGRHH